MASEQGKQVLLHIDDAQSWLSRASSDFQAAEPIRGELDLSLAQAEVKYAWELSRGRAGLFPNIAKRRAVRWWLPVAACLGVGLLGLTLPRLIFHPERRGLAVVQQAAPEPKARVALAGQPASIDGAPTTVPARAGRTAIHHPPAAANEPSRGITAAQTGEARAADAADTDGGLAVDVGELERVAHETLIAGSNSTDRQH